MKTPLMLLAAITLATSAHAGDKPAPRASPVDPYTAYQNVEHLSIKQICELGYTFIGPIIRNREGGEDNGTITAWDFQGISLYPFPMIVEVAEYPSYHELNVATSAAQEEANVAYQWMKEKTKALISQPSPTTSSPIPAPLNKWKAIAR
jgi:hypothetical protein